MREKVFYNPTLVHYNKTAWKRSLQDIPMKYFAVWLFDNSAAAQNHGVSVVEQGNRAVLLRCEILGCEVQSVAERGSGG
ncbi:hypothetical protein [Treponema socranskii]|uniref:hypothetical protein n=1 Tax=Treponema socranskii TaxID=53419 RepID=UPI003D91F74B